MKKFLISAPCWACVSLFAVSSSFAQVASQEPQSAAEAVRSALAKKEGEGDNKKLLQDTLTAKDR